MDRDAMKKAAAEAALDYIEYGDIVGVGTGSTADHFIDALAGIKAKLDGAVASSEASAQRLQQLGIPVLDLNTTGDLRIYVDGTDEATRHLHLIKGGEGHSLGRRLLLRRVRNLSASQTTQNWSTSWGVSLCLSK